VILAVCLISSIPYLCRLAVTVAKVRKNYVHL